MDEHTDIGTKGQPCTDYNKMRSEKIGKVPCGKRFGDTRYVYKPTLSPCLTASMGMGGGYVPMIIAVVNNENRTIR